MTIRTAGAWAGRVVAWIAIALVAAIVVSAAIVPRLLHAVPLTVLSGSMRPGIEPGDLLIVQPVRDVGRLAVGDVITFQPVSDDPALITHRVVAIGRVDGEVVSLTTRGDANGADDDPIVPGQVQGVLRYCLPKIGWLASWMTGGRAYVVTAAIIGLLGYAGYCLIRGGIEAAGRRREAVAS